MIANFPSFLYTSRGKKLAVHQYAESEASLEVAGQRVTIAQTTDYPWDGDVTLKIRVGKPAVWSLALRIPGWCKTAKIKVNGIKFHHETALSKGYVQIKRAWNSEDVVSISFAMPVERIQANPAVRQDAGSIALRRGPVLYCLESVDNGSGLRGISLSGDPEFKVVQGRGPLLNGIPVIRVKATRVKAAAKGDPLYASFGNWPRVSCTVTAIPYHLWANRTPGEMIVWIRQD